MAVSWEDGIGIYCEVLLNAVNDLMVFWDGETVFPPVVDESIPVYPLLVDNIG